MIDLPEEFLNRMKARLGSDFAEFLKSYESAPVRAIRVNTLKTSVRQFENLSPLPLDGNVPWERNGFYTPAEGLGKTVAHAAGLYYVQEPSAMCAAPKLAVKAGERVLDLCSAPGGKGTQLAQEMHGEGVLVLNEIAPKRAEILRSNVERLGVKNAVVTCADPENLKDIFLGYFDKILVDAPCSGEGMFKKEPNAIPEWSVENVKICAQRQARILECADKMLAGGGRLVYSTCTFAPEEDEEQIENFLKTHKNYSLLSAEKLLPHKVRGEGHFCAVLEKSSAENCPCAELPQIIPTVRDKSLLKIYRGWESATLNFNIERLLQRNSSLYYVPQGTPDLSRTKLAHFSGVYLGKLSQDGKRFEPSHALAMCLKGTEVRCAEVDEKTALQYLRGLTFERAEPDGWRAVTYSGYPLGWCKIAGGTAKNHLPKGLRI